MYGLPMGVIQTSDARDKKDITDLDAGLSSILQLRPVSYQWKEGHDQSVHIGLLAQEVMEILPQAVRTTNFISDEDGTISEINSERLGLNYATLTPVLIKAIQEQQALILQQQTMISDLLERVEKLETP